MYGTTMIGTLAADADADSVRAAMQDWEKARTIAGYQSSHLMMADDGKTVVTVAVFDSKESYLALAADPAQDAWWTEKMQPLLAGDPQWIDGDWIS